VAVVQISKIQVRRGQKNSQSGIPQLSSAEFAWAVDTQELFIGNGSVAEGAPYVGNTKILTANDNILELASSYRFGSADNAIQNSVPRSLQSKLDEYVSVTDYGATGDGTTDNSVAFQTAFTDLFRNTDPKYKKVLLVPNGDYVFTNDLEIPSNAYIRGETRDGARLIFNANFARLITETGSGLVDFSSTNRPENINISNLTIKRTTGTVILTGLSNGMFDNVLFEGVYVLGDVVASLFSEPSAVFWNNTIAGTVTTDVTFNKCEFRSNSVSVKCIQTVFAESEIDFVDCDFFVNDTGVYVEATPGQLTSWKFLDSRFEEIAREAFKSNQGRNTLLQRCSFKNCGNGTNDAANPQTNVIYFGDDRSNLVLDCSFNRQQSAGIVTSISIPSISEVYNSNVTTIYNRIFSPIFLSDSFRPLTVLSADNRFIYINYLLRLGTYNRIGQITMSTNDALTWVSITDSYQYSDSLATSTGGLIMTNFEFDAQLQDNNADSGADTVVLLYKNPVLSGALGNISFDVSYGV
jgi:hypothetical protein